MDDMRNYLATNGNEKLLDNPCGGSYAMTPHQMRLDFDAYYTLPVLLHEDMAHRGQRVVCHPDGRTEKLSENEFQRLTQEALLPEMVNDEPRVSEITDSQTGRQESEAKDSSSPVESYIDRAVRTRDPFAQVHAKLFRPSDPRLQYDPIHRTMPDGFMETALQKTSPVSMGSVEKDAPELTAATDEIEAKMLMDELLVGDGAFKDIQLYDRNGQPLPSLLVLLRPCRRSMTEVRELYGPPTKTVREKNCQRHYYGRLVLVETPNDKVHVIMRRVVVGRTEGD
jgi:hypothetical protein